MQDLNQNPLEGLDEQELKLVQQRVREAIQEVHTNRENARMSALVAEYREKMFSARGKPYELKRIREHYEQLGVKTGNVDFS